MMYRICFVCCADLNFGSGKACNSLVVQLSQCSCLSLLQYPAAGRRTKFVLVYLRRCWQFIERWEWVYFDVMTSRSRSTIFSRKAELLIEYLLNPHLPFKKNFGVGSIDHWPIFYSGWVLSATQQQSGSVGRALTRILFRARSGSLLFRSFFNLLTVTHKSYFYWSDFLNLVKAAGLWTKFDLVFLTSGEQKFANSNDAKYFRASTRFWKSSVNIDIPVNSVLLGVTVCVC